MPSEITRLQSIALLARLGLVYVRAFPRPDVSADAKAQTDYHTARGDRHIWIWQCHQIYGPYFRDSPNGVIFNSPSAQRTIYDAKANVTKGKYYSMWPMNADSINTWATIDKVKHARKRRILNAAFSDKALRSAEPYLIQHADRWCELLLLGTEAGWSEAKNMADWANYLVFDILGDLCYARSFGMKEPGPNELKFIPGFICDYMKFGHSLAHSPWSPVWLWLKPRGLDKVMEYMRPQSITTYFKWVESCLTQRIKEEEDLQNGLVDKAGVRNDMFHHIFQAKDPETGNLGYNKGELFSESDLLIIAGSDTTSTIFAGMFFYMTRFPLVYDRLIAEIRSTFTNSEEVHAGQQLTSCRYLRAFIDETMRMSPPVTSELSREVLQGGFTVDGHVFKEGAKVGVSSYSLHRNESIIQDPSVFRPERWILDEKNGVTAESIAAVESAFYPFSSG
ncbi:MAG: hypothetical protein Q9195_009058 [Heterodermia aff. obscurata]